MSDAPDARPAAPLRVLASIARVLDRPRGSWAVIGVALVLSLPALAAPLVADEHLQAVRWRERGAIELLDDCFVFASGEPEEARARLEELGAWWTPDDLRISFWRPLSAATHVLDLALWPGSAVLMHAHTLLWLGALLALLDVLFRRLLSTRAATLALATYAWDDARGGLLSWVANRHALVAAALCVAALIAHDRARRDGWRAGAWIGPLAFGLGLLASESALAAVGLLLGHALFVDRAAWSRRLASLAPWALVASIWQAVYVARGHGVVASGGYLHPLADPVAYLTHAPGRIAALVLGQLTILPSDLWPFAPSAVRVVLAMIAVGALVMVGRSASARVGRLAAVRSFALGAVIALVPIASAGPGDRNLTFVGIGVAAVLGSLFDALLDAPPVQRAARWGAGALVGTHLVLAPLLLPLKCLANVNLDAMRVATDAPIPRDPSITTRTLVVVSAASEGGVFFAWSWRHYEGLPMPRGTRLLSTGLGTTRVERLDERTLVVEPEGGFLATDLQQLLRSPSRPFRVGDEVVLSDTRVTVRAIEPDGRARSIEVRFATPLESPEWLWMRGAGLGLVPWTPPAVGETVLVPAPL